MQLRLGAVYTQDPWEGEATQPNPPWADPQQLFGDPATMWHDGLYDTYAATHRIRESGDPAIDTDGYEASDRVGAQVVGWGPDLGGSWGDGSGHVELTYQISVDNTVASEVASTAVGLSLWMYGVDEVGNWVGYLDADLVLTSGIEGAYEGTLVWDLASRGFTVEQIQGYISAGNYKLEIIAGSPASPTPSNTDYRSTVQVHELGLPPAPTIVYPTITGEIGPSRRAFS